MPLELQIIRASEFIRLGARGHLDLAASCEILRQLAIACRRRTINQALLDLRDVRPGATPMLTRNDLLSLVNTFRDVGFSNQLRLAVLDSADPHRRARLFAFMTTLRGWSVKASDNFEEALLWLSQGGTIERRKGPGEQEIPVHVAGRANGRQGRSQTRQETSKQNGSPPPGRRHPPSATSTKVPIKQVPLVEPS